MRFQFQAKMDDLYYMKHTLSRRDTFSAAWPGKIVHSFSIRHVA